MKVRHKRKVKRFVMLLGLCVALGVAINFVAKPHVSDHAPFDLDRELELLPEDQRAAAREKWESLSEEERQQAREISSRMSRETKKQVLEKLKSQGD